MSHPLRAPLVSRLGERGFLGVYTLVSFATLGWLIWAMLHVGPEPFLWAAPLWVWWLAGAVMLVASILLVGSLIGNPALPGMPALKRTPRGVFAITRHPMMWSFALWACAHALVWPQPSVLVLTAGIALLALAGAAGQDAKKSRLQPDFWPAWRAQTAFVPFTGPASSRDWWPGWGVMLGGLALWLVATWLHPVFGGPAVGVWG
ncbi:hypothetical protein SCH01S_25_00010 [Sphingomonas changbaiensis NBRC 104936]|uniref:NnrU domain-containing protein n=2 Tax=Sphingomonas changbaiensis TaxID=529705 RepID=A0A0E9MNM6_9SPHN|nr:hypothetical protein SCH01S_25_00010 [Sphingomonas changbaiensis NBRC 104936]